MLLALDTASPTVTVAVADGAQVLAEERSSVALRHGEHLAPLITQVLTAAGLRPGDLSAIVVGVGPGPFTGLRVGLVTARTMAHVLEIPVHGVCSLDAMAAEALASGAVSGDFLVVTDARRREVYLASYDEHGHRTALPVVDKPALLASALPAVGEGAALYPEAFDRGVSPLRPSAGWLARAVAAESVEVLPAEPLYLRRPDAEIPRAPKAVLSDIAPTP
ncbi:MAG: tRNA (adenosine(37)-N6)-threonylcarbamoyltransferase complex dimerization subunit type 1 TsaB [Nocardioidaceae bacterium]|nr:tRNA (adenosine(37)-N6)-threonylcarbamoyltransferase complex dimerization subunit type 1 TsaB [Nocardioidaceae bacterium]